MGQDQSRPPPIRGNYDFSANNFDSVFEVGYDELLSIDDILSTLFISNSSQKSKALWLPDESLLINIILNPTVFTRYNKSSDVWHNILAPLFIGSSESRPYMQQLLSSFFQSIKDRSENTYNKEKESRTAILDKITDERRALINVHNPKTKVNFDLNSETIKALKSHSDYSRFVSIYFEQRCKKLFNPSNVFFPFSQKITKLLKESNEDSFAFTAIRWGMASSDLSPLIDGFVQITKDTLNGVIPQKKISLHLLAAAVQNLTLTNSAFIPTSASLVGSSALSSVELSVNPISSLYSDGKHLYLLGKRSTLIIVDLSKSITKNNQRVRFETIRNLGKERLSLCLTGGNNHLIIFSKNTSQSFIYRLNPFGRVEGSINYQSDLFFSTPKLKTPFTSDGKFIYSVDSARKLAIFSIEDPPNVRFIKFVEFQSSNVLLVVPFDRALVPKEWLIHSTVFTNGVIFSFLILRRADNNNFSYFMRNFSLADGSHVSDVSFALKWPILSLSIDPWNGCIWAISPNQDQVNVLKMHLNCSLPPWFTGNDLFSPPTFHTVISSLLNAESCETVSYGLINFLDYYSYHFYSSSFHGLLSNPQYNINIAHSFAPCTNEAIHSLLRSIKFFIRMFVDTKRTKLWTTEKIKASIVIMIRLLEYNLSNFETRYLDDSQQKIILLESNKGIIKVLSMIIRDNSLRFAHKASCFTIVNNFGLLFKNDYSQCPSIFLKINELMPNDFGYFMLQKLHNLHLFSYCFTPETFKRIFNPIIGSMARAKPNQIELIKMFHRSIMYEMYHIYSTSPIEIDPSYKIIQDTFFCFISSFIDQMTIFIKKLPNTYDEKLFTNSSFISLFSKWLLLFQPFSDFTRVSAVIATLFKPIFNALTEKIKQFNIDSPIRKDKNEFYKVYWIFFQIYSVYIHSLSSLLDGGSEFSDTTRYSWLIKSTLSSQLTITEINQIVSNMFSNKEDILMISDKKLQKGLSFKISNKTSISKLIEFEFLRNMISPKAPESIISLFNFLYDSVPNRFNKRLNENDKHFERVIFSAFMKQLGFINEVIDLHTNILEGNFMNKGNESNHKSVLTHYLKQTMEMIYRIRMILNVSKQATKQLELSQQNDLPLRPIDSLKQNYSEYKQEVFRKCIFLLHIQPCLRFQSQSFEVAFPNFLNRIRSFIVSEVSLDQYFCLIDSSEIARVNVSLGLQLINDVLTSSCICTCKYFLIEKLASSPNFLTFLTAMSDDSFTEAANSCIDAIKILLNHLCDLMRLNTCLNTQVIFFLNLILMIRHIGDNVIYNPLLQMISVINDIKDYMCDHNYRSFIGIIATALYVLCNENPEIVHNQLFIESVQKLCQNHSIITAKDLSLAHICMKMNVSSHLTIHNMIELMQNIQPEYYYSACNLFYDVIKQDPKNNEGYFWILNEISQISLGGVSKLMIQCKCITSDNPLKYEYVKTPDALLSGASSLIQLCRKILQSNSQASQHLCFLFELILKRSNEIQMFYSSHLLFSIFAILSNSIDVIRMSSLIQNKETNNIYFINSFTRDGYSCWQLPLNSHSVPQEVRLSTNNTPISIIPFSPHIFSNFDLLIPYFLNHLESKQNNITDEALSYYVMASFREYCNDPIFLTKIFECIPKIPLSHVEFGDSTNDFMNILKCHLFNESDGFFSNLSMNSPKTFFNAVSLVTCNARSNYFISFNCLKSIKGINTFISNFNSQDKPISLTLNIPTNTKFDAGLFVPSSQPNGSKTLLLIAHNSKPFILGSQQKDLMKKPSKLIIKYTPSTHEATIIDEITNEKLIKTFFSSQNITFVIVLYGEASINYSFNDKKPSLYRKSYTPLSKSSSFHLPSLKHPTFTTMNEKECTRHYSQISMPTLLEYPRNMVEPSLQKITTSIPYHEKPVYSQTTFSDFSYVGFQVPSNLVYETTQPLLIDKTVDITNIPSIISSTGQVSKAKENSFISLNYFPPFHPSNFDIMPTTLLNHHLTGIIPKLRDQTKVSLLIKYFSTPNIPNLDSYLNSFFPSISSIFNFLLSIIIYIEPLKPLNILKGTSPINFEFNNLDPKVQHRSEYALHSATIHKILNHVQEKGSADMILNHWLKSLSSEFNNAYSHSVRKNHHWTVVLPYTENEIKVSQKHAICWLVLQSGFGTTSESFASFRDCTSNSKQSIDLLDDIICLKGSSFIASIKNQHTNRNIVAIPCFNRNESLYGTFFELLLSFKYFVYYFKSKIPTLINSTIKSIRLTLYSLFVDGFNARSPFFTTFGSDFLQFLLLNVPIIPSDLNETLIYKLSLLSIYTPANTFPYIHQFIEDQQNVLDEIYIFGGQDLFNDSISPSASIDVIEYQPLNGSLNGSPNNSINSPRNNSLTNSTSGTFNTPTNGSPNSSQNNSPNSSSNNSKFKLFDSPFPDVISEDEYLPKIISNVKRVLVKRRDVHSCPFHLLLHKWIQYSSKYPSTKIRFISDKVCVLTFSFFTPQKFRFKFNVMPTSIRFRIAFDEKFNNSRYFPPDAPISTKGHSDLFISIEDDEDIKFSDMYFYVESDDQILIEDFIMQYKSQFVLDAKVFFIHWDVKNDQTLLQCFPPKPYYRHSMSLLFDPINIQFSHLNYPINILCCRLYFLMIINFYYTRNRSYFAKDATLHSFLPSILMKIKIEKFRKLVSHSDEEEGEYFKINRKAAFEVRDGQSKNLDFTLISQLTSIYTTPSHFRVAGETPWKVHLIGEQGCDVGGLARELVTEAAIDLITPNCGLVVPVPNALNENNPAQSNWVIPIPNKRHKNILKQYNFAGALIGIAIRCELTQEFNFPPLVWEYLMHGTISLDRIFEIDHNFQTLIHGLKQASATGVVSSISKFNLRFVVQNSMGVDSLLTQRGSEEVVNFSNVESYIAMATEFRINEMKEYLDAMAHGLWENLSMNPPKYLDWQTLEFAACGEKDVPVDALQKLVIFFEVPRDQQDIFWRVLKHFTSAQRSLFLKFSTGRVRIPAQNITSPFLTIDFSHSDVDKMPTASTCFNQLHLPRYTSFEKAYKLISLAIEYTGTFEIV
ncbi:hypothetical protein TRFO_35816 [Tritrichomonas foetus]|uniref:HECT domain-containing protein n=1 Tax=Tritrichomonas foetus TaxID=1144522 RepID=A0A1J4JK22_9EUKA|nr:hypothetical protein TRFO_35816 [Tritrichomonas foetus]|eukprot:OHS97883.1 hypothetical protein TRFO_35816 [Tritrichomonas foetus]